MKHKMILFIVLIVLLSLAISVNAQATSIKIWINGGANDATALQTAAQAFTTKTGIGVTVEAVDWSNATAQYLAAINAGTGADIVIGGESYPIDFGNIGGLVDLKAAYPNDIQAVLDGSSKAMEQALIGSDGKVYGVPYHEDMLLMYYLPDALTKAGISKAPTTWDELTAAATALKAANLGTIGMGWGGVSWLNYQDFLAQAGGSWYSADCSASAINSDAGMKALQYFTSLYSDLGTPQDASDPSALNTGAVSILFDGEWQAAGIDATYPDLKGKWAVAPLPTGPGGNNDSFVGGEGISIFSYSKNKDAAWQFIQWLQTPEAEQAIVTQEASFSSLFVPPQAANQQFIVGAPTVNATINAQAANLTPPPNCAGWEQIGTDINNALQAVVLQNGDYQDGLTAMEKAINDGLVKYGSAATPEATASS